MPISDNKTQPCSYSTYMYGDKAEKRADATTELYVDKLLWQKMHRQKQYENRNGNKRARGKR